MPRRRYYGGPVGGGGGMRPVELGAQWKFGETLNRDAFARLGKVVRVDEENGVVDLRWLDYGGTAVETAVSVPYATRRGVGHGMPSRGAVAVCVFVKYSAKIGKPVIVGWLKAPFTGAKLNELDLGFGMFSTLTHDFVVEQGTITMEDRIGAGAERGRLRKIHPGDVHWLSDHGGELFLDENVQLSSSALDEFLLRADDQTANLATGTSRVATEAGRRRFGVAFRNDVIAWRDNEFDAESREEEKDAQDAGVLSVRRKLTRESRIAPVVTRAGKFLYMPTPLVSRDTIDGGGTPWVEDILEMREVSDGVKDVCEEVHDHDLDSLYPPSSAGDNHTDIFLRRAFGTLIGNDPTDKASYGVPLYRRIFASHDSWQPDAPGKEYYDAEDGQKKQTSSGPKWVPVSRTYLENDTIERASFPEKAGLGGDESRLRMRENQEASIAHLEFAHTGQFGRNADADSVRNTAFDVTKEGVVQFLISASSDEHPIVCTEGKEESEELDAWKSSGRSVEGHFEGSVKLSLGANTNEEESFRQTAIGKTVHLWGASEHQFGEHWKDKQRPDPRATAFVMDGYPGSDGGGPGVGVLELKAEGETERRDWPVRPTGLRVANRRRSERRSTWGGIDWFLGRTVDNCLSWSLATAGQVKQLIGASPAPATVNEEEAEATNAAGRAGCSVVRRTIGSVEERIGTNEKAESWNTVFDGQIKHRVGFTENPAVNTDGSLDVVGPNGPGRARNSINREVRGSIEEHVGANDQEESYSAVFDGQLKIRIGVTTTPSAQRRNTAEGLDVSGPFGAGDKGNSVNLQLLGSLEANIGKNQLLGDSVYINTLGGWDVNILGPDNAGKAVNILARGDWADSISGKQTRVIGGEYTRTAAKHTLVGDVFIVGNLDVTGNVHVVGDLHADGQITDVDGTVH